MPTEALGSAKEAHRQWPEGRSEQGASKAKDGPSHGGALPRETLQLRNRDGRAALFRAVAHLFSLCGGNARRWCCGLPPVLRGHFHLKAEAAIEVRDVLVSALEGDGFDWQGAFFKQACGVVDAQVMDVVQPRFSEVFSK